METRSHPWSLSQFSQFSRSVVSDSETPWTAACQASLSITNSRSLPKLMSIELVMPSNHLILCLPFFSRLQSFPASSNEHSGLLFFRMDWLDLFAVQGTLKSLLQHRSSKPPILQRSTFFTVQLAHPYMTTGKAIAL